MARHIAHRLMISLPVLLGVLLIGFLLLQVVPTDPATVVAGPTATKAEIDAIRNDLGLNQPLWVQFGRYLGRVFQLDLGRSMISNRAVVDEIALTLWPTIELMLACLIWAVPLGITLGTLAARRRGTLIDRAIMALSVMGVSVPVFWVGLLLIQYVGGAGILPFQGRNGPIWTPDGFLSIILPAVTLGAVFVGPVARMTRTSLLETLGADYVRTARAKGASDWRVTVRHALSHERSRMKTRSSAIIASENGQSPSSRPIDRCMPMSTASAAKRVGRQSSSTGKAICATKARNMMASSSAATASAA